MNALNDGQSYIIDRYSISMMPSASALRCGRGRRGRVRGIEFGDQDIGDAKLDLSYARTGGERYCRYPASVAKVFIRKEATEEALRKYGSDYTYLHFATHGQFNPEFHAIGAAPDSRFPLQWDAFSE